MSAREIVAPDIERRPVAVAAFYGGNQVAHFSRMMAKRKACGPAEYGRPTWPVVAKYDELRQRTMVGFSPDSPAGVLGDWDKIRALMIRFGVLVPS